MFSVVQRPLGEESRRAMKDFYKAIHPDLFERAPGKVKEENERSLKQLNNYMDCLKRNSGSTSVILKFYAANKDNVKSKKFLYFQVELPAFLPNSEEDSLKLHEMAAVKKLKTGLYTVQIQNNPFGEHAKKLKEANAEEEQQALNWEKDYPELLVKSTSKMEREMEAKSIREVLRNEVSQRRHDQFRDMIERNLKKNFNYQSRATEAANEVYEDLESTKLQRKLIENEITQSMLFVDQKVHHDIVVEFLENLANAAEKDLQIKEALTAFKNFNAQNNNKARIMLSNRNGVVPGIVIVDCKTSVKDALDYALKNIALALQKRTESYESSDSLNEFCDLLKSDFGVTAIDLDGAFSEAVDIEDVVTKKALFLRKLSLVLDKLKRLKFHELLTGLIVRLAPKGIKVESNGHVWNLCWNFDERLLLKQLSNCQKSANLNR